jgi:hypothetical protein
MAILRQGTFCARDNSHKSRVERAVVITIDGMELSKERSSNWEQGDQIWHIFDIRAIIHNN